MTEFPEGGWYAYCMTCEQSLSDVYFFEDEASIVTRSCKNHEVRTGHFAVPLVAHMNPRRG